MPDYGKYPQSMLFYIVEASFYSQRPFVQFVLSGIFDRFPRLKFVMTENGCAWLPPLLAHIDGMLKSIRGGAPSARSATPRTSGTVSLLAVGGASSRTAGWA